MEGQQLQKQPLNTGTVSFSYDSDSNHTVVSLFTSFIENVKPRLHELVDNFQAGRLSDFTSYWRTLTKDRNILNTVSGLSIEFIDLPYQNFIPKEYKHTDEELGYLTEEIEKLLRKGVIEKAKWDDTQFISNIFLRDKKDGSYRMILNLSKLNESVEYHKFKMDTFISALSLITPNCYMASIDFKDAYYSVPIKKEHRKWLRFMFQNQLYEFTCLPNGLSSGPRLFTKITKPLFANLRELGHLNSPYIDDSILVGEDWEDCARNVKDTVEMAMDAGFVIHPIKSIFIPTQEIEFLGFWINSIYMTVTLTRRKAEVIQKLCSELLTYKRPTIRTVARVVGKMVSSFPAIRYGKLFYRQIDNEKTEALKINKGNYEGKMRLSNKAKLDLKWWVDNVLTGYCPIVEKKPDITIYSDASLKGWGGVRDKSSTGGNWSENESRIHINVLELMAAHYVLASLCKNETNIHIRMMIDNKTAVAYINGMGGRKNTCNLVTRKIWDWCIERNIWLSAAYITSQANFKADKMSRISHQNSEWELSQTMFDRIVTNFGMPSLDLFASRLNHKCDRYVAWQPDPFAEAVDAFSLDWGKEKLLYIFPPFCIINRVLQKIDLDEADAIIIVPYWTTQPWWSKLLRLLTALPFYFTRSKGALSHPQRGIEELPRMDLLVCSLSGTHWKQTRYLNKPKRSFCLGGDRPLQNNTRFTTSGGRNMLLEGVYQRILPL